MTNGCIIPGNKPLVKQFFPKNCENPKNRRKKEPPGGRFFFCFFHHSHHFRGRMTVTVVPSPSRLVRDTVPWW